MVSISSGLGLGAARPNLLSPSPEKKKSKTIYKSYDICIIIIWAMLFGLDFLSDPYRSDLEEAKLAHNLRNLGA